MSAHADLVAANSHVIGYVDTGDPGAIGAGKTWVDTNGGTGNWVVKIRNAANDGWETAGSGGGSNLRTFVIAIDKDDVTADVLTIPAYSIIERVHIARTTAWDWGVSGSFEIGTTADPDWLANNTDTNLGTAAPDIETVDAIEYVTTSTDIKFTWTQDGATVGAGYVVIKYITLV